MQPDANPPGESTRLVTTRTIAREAGVNVATVSRALRGLPSVSQDTRDRIRAVANRMGYRPNPLVAVLTAQVRTHRRNPYPPTIALLDCWPAKRPAWVDFDKDIDYVNGIHARADTLGYRIERFRLCDIDNSLERLQKLLLTRRICGLLVLPVPPDMNLSGLDFSRLACATIDFSLQLPSVMRRASPHYYHNALLALTTLANRGYRHIGYATTHNTSQRCDDLGVAAFLAFAARHPKICVPVCRADDATRQQAIVAWMRHEKPDALICTDLLIPDDYVRAGYRVPEDLAVVSLAHPRVPAGRVAYVDEDYHEVGAQAVDMIVDAIHRNDFGLPSKHIVHFVDGFWQEGGSVRPP